MAVPVTVAVRRLRIAIDEAAVERAMPHRDFVPVELLGPIPAPNGVAPAEASPQASPDEPMMPIAPIRSELDEGWADRTSLFGEPEA